MIPILCVDDKGGTAFNHRRQSRDRVLLADVLALAKGRELWMNAYSAKLFPPDAPVTVDEDFLSKAGPGALCFVEGAALEPCLDRIESVILFRWNRVYPADSHMDLDLRGWTLAEQTEFPGSSHETITKEIYTR